MCGFGIRQCSDLAPICFYASFIKFLDFIKQDRIELSYEPNSNPFQINNTSHPSNIIFTVLQSLKCKIQDAKHRSLLLPKSNSHKDMLDFISYHNSIKTVFKLQHLTTRAFE